MIPRCLELEAKHEKLAVEVKTTNELLFLAIQEKLKQQQQIEDWQVIPFPVQQCDMLHNTHSIYSVAQSDMALVLESRMKYKLAEQRKLSAKQWKQKKSSSSSKDFSCCCCLIIDTYFPGLNNINNVNN